MRGTGGKESFQWRTEKQWEVDEDEQGGRLSQTHVMVWRRYGGYWRKRRAPWFAPIPWKYTLLPVPQFPGVMTSYNVWEAFKTYWYLWDMSSFANHDSKPQAGHGTEHCNALSSCVFPPPLLKYKTRLSAERYIYIYIASWKAME